MYKYSILLVLTILLFTSCKHNTAVIYYEYGGVIIKRVDKPGETDFYYLGSNSKNSSGKIWAKYSGINDGFSGYLRFHKNGKVEVLSGDGYFQSNVVDTNKFSYKRISYERINLADSICIIMLSTRYEVERNMANKTQVKVTYKKL